MSKIVRLFVVPATQAVETVLAHADEGDFIQQEGKPLAVKAGPGLSFFGRRIKLPKGKAERKEYGAVVTDLWVK